MGLLLVGNRQFSLSKGRGVVVAAICVGDKRRKVSHDEGNDTDRGGALSLA